MINLLRSIFTILKLLFNGDIKITQEDSKLKITIGIDIETVQLVTYNLILDYERAFIGCDKSPEEILETQETLNGLDNILKELNITHSCK
jgi:hypothetical protein